MNKLFQPITLGDLFLKNRIVMAPMTRSRANKADNAANELMATYYAQRSSAGLIITEATQISLQGQGYARTPGIYTPAHVAGWRKVTNAVHQKGGLIFLQLWHVGRVSSSQVNGLQPIGPSSLIAKDTSVYIFGDHPKGDAQFVPVELPREMGKADIEQVVNEFRQAAIYAIEAGFDGVEIHGANGYLIDQFLRSNSNQRFDQYGGSKENRTRLLLEVTEAVAMAIGGERTGVRLSPFIKFKDMDDPEILETIMLAANKLNKFHLAYLHLSEADWDDAPQIPLEFRTELRKIYKGNIIATGNKTPEQGEELLSQKLVDLIGFGRKFISNPNYPERIQHQLPLNEISDSHTLFGGGDARGYTDYA